MTENNLLKAKALLNKYQEDTCTEEERAWVEDWYLKMNTERTDLSAQELSADLVDLQARYKNITTTKQLRRLNPLITVAASLLLVAGAGLYLFTGPLKGPKVQQSIVISDVAAGTNKAVLTLSNGKRISLSEAGNGTLASDANTEISKSADGQITYHASGENIKENYPTNTVETPNGGQFQVILPDGTKVWLNAASSLKYPTQFAGKLRTVELTGEGYFQVAHNKNMPFIVKTPTQSVKVLGTHFNINSYADENSTVTTLEQGSVLVQSGAKSKQLIPGNQTILSANGYLNMQSANMETAMAWKNNKMIFEDAGIEEIMRQVARWYDIDIKYEGKVPDDTFSGALNRQSTLATVLKMFELTAIKFKVEQTGNRKILIIKT